MVESPKSLTAVIHVRFHYGEAKTKATESGIEDIGNTVKEASS